MRYIDGTPCWQGPHRQLTVLLECGGEEAGALVEVSEPSICEYQFKFITPAACKEEEKEVEVKDEEDLKDEL